MGFLPGAPRVAVAAALERHLDDLRGGRSLLCVLREPAGPLRGLGLWEHDRGFPFEHVAGLKRLMVDPGVPRAATSAGSCSAPWSASRAGSCRTSSCSASTTATVSGSASSMPARAGPRWAGIPRGLKLSETDYRDDVAMARRVDGLPLR